MDQFLAARKEKKRKIDECQVALNVIRSSRLCDIIQAKWPEDDILAFLRAKYGQSTLEIARTALQNIRPINLFAQHKKTKTEFGIVSVVVNAGVPENEVEQFVELLSLCENYLAFSLNEALEETYKKIGVPCVLLTPPYTLMNDGCLICGSELRTHNDSCGVTIFKITGPVLGRKVCWKCTGCGLNYNYSMYGNTENGYKFYANPRPLIEASNVTYVDRLICNYQIQLA